MDKFKQLLWQALKNEACVYPKTAKIIVTLNENDFNKAFDKWMEENKLTVHLIDWS